ncbi:MAG: hypothetical protein J6Y37_07045 [Paludibacteraceae bacterium]|nr:hypothetical protein [Paludibacteraceae bacterium]
MKVRDKDIINDMKLMLNERTPSMTVESLVFGEGMPSPDENFDDGYEDSYDDFDSDGDITPIKSNDDDKIARNVSPVDAEIKPLIDQIRILSLKGIAKLAKNPTSDSYQLLKKIWAAVDKAAENANKQEQTKQNV